MAAAIVAMSVAGPAPASEETAAGDAAAAALRLYLAEPPAPRLLVAESKKAPSHEGGLIIIDPDAPTAPGAGPPTGETDENGDPIITFDRPIGTGPVPINGRSIKQLIDGQPEFPPIEGLDPKIWQKHCDTCHQWTKARICEQAKTYVGTGEKMIFRLSHPYGAPFKVALMRWAKSGCR